MTKRWLTIFALLISSSAFASKATYPSFLVKTNKELAALDEKIKRTRNKSEKAWLRWQYALNAPQLGQTSRALSVLKDLERTKQDVIGPDQIQLTKGRILFQQGQFDDAVEAYQNVPKSSEFWFEATEEEAWSYIRLSEHDRATGKLATLFTPLFATWVGPESFFAANYNYLKICDYSNIFKNGKLFKKRHASRIVQLEELVEKGSNSQLQAAVNRLESGEMKYLAFANEAAALPRFFWRDEFLRAHVNSIQNTNQNNKSKRDRFRAKIVSRLQVLAKAELAEYRTVIQKMQIIEAEVIQRLYLDESLKGERPEAQPIDTDANTLVFKHDDESQRGEVWLDEIDRIQATVKSCPQLKEAKL